MQTSIREMYRLSFLLLFAPGLLAQVERDGECNLAVNAVQDLNLTQLLGTWHQIARIPSEIETGYCSVLSLNGTYDATGNIAGIDFSLSEVLENGTIVHSGNVLSSPALGVYVLNFTDGNTVLFSVQTIEYGSQAILYSCVAISPTKKLVWAWQYHRNATITDEQKAVLNYITDLSPDLKGVSWNYTQEASVCKNKGLPLTPGILVVALLGSLLSFVNGPNHLLNLFY